MFLNTSVRHPQSSSTNRLSRKDRLFKVQLLIAVGKSNREIAKELRVDEGTIRRDRLTLKLSKEELQAVRAGAAVEPLLRKQERRKAATAREKHEAAERESQFLTNRLAKWIGLWLSEFPYFGPPDSLHIAFEVGQWSWTYQGPTAACVSDPKIKETIAATKPRKDQFLMVPELIEHAKEWLIRWIVLVEPDREIRNRALGQIKQALEKQVPA